MPAFSLPDLERLLVEQQLVEPLRLQDCKRSLGGRLSAEELVRALEQQTCLTSYQAQKLLAGETDSLRVGRYKLLYRNASGSFARVFRACAVDDGRIVAIKLLRQRFADDPRTVSSFKREGELGKRLKHKNIVPIYEVQSDGRQHYFTMEFVEGGNFRDFLKIRRKFSVSEATQYVLDLAEGLEYALGLGLTHRDLKLTNVLLSAQGVAKLVDFGLAGQDSAWSAMEDDGDRAIEYATLERGTQAPNNDPRSDLYFLGAIYYELLTGRPPYPPTSDRDERKQFSRYRDVRPLRSVDPAQPSTVARIVERLMHITPQERYQTPTQAIADLRMILSGGQPVAAASAPPPAAPATTPTIICVETRPKLQDALRDYFSNHGYRVLVLTDPMRALNRTETEAIQGLILIGDALGDDIGGVYQTAISRCRRQRIPVVLALSPELSDWRDQLSDHEHARVLSESVTLRAIRTALQDLSAKRAS
ncbi:MAG TPA: serine/threonine-protein kinase [Planctomycetaceae bacterium]|nr:serine/threonine-protein kinase [Planctomycetaceae bacterium]